MSHFAEELNRQIRANNLTQVELAVRSGISQAQISKWIRSEQTSLQKEQMDALAPALSEKPVENAALLRAHLLDEMFGPGADLISIDIQTTDEAHDRPRLRSAREKAIQFLSQQALVNDDLKQLLVRLARCLGADV